MLARMFISPLLFLSAVFCELYGRKAKNENMKAHVFSAFFSVMLAFMVLRLYYITGPAVWTFAVILILVSLLRVGMKNDSYNSYPCNFSRIVTEGI